MNNSIQKYPDSIEQVAAFAQGLHELGDFIAEHPELGIPLSMNLYGKNPKFTFYANGAAGLAAFARLMGRVTKSTDGMHYKVTADTKIGNITLEALDNHSAVCTKVTKTRMASKEVEVGTTVEQVPASERVVGVYETREVEETYEEWECPESLLAEATP